MRFTVVFFLFSVLAGVSQNDSLKEIQYTRLVSLGDSCMKALNKEKAVFYYDSASLIHKTCLLDEKQSAASGGDFKCEEQKIYLNNVLQGNAEFKRKFYGPALRRFEYALAQWKNTWYGKTKPFAYNDTILLLTFKAEVCRAARAGDTILEPMCKRKLEQADSCFKLRNFNAEFVFLKMAEFLGTDNKQVFLRLNINQVNRDNLRKAVFKSYCDEGKLLFSRKDYKNALLNYEKALSLFPSDKKAGAKARQCRDMLAKEK